MATATRIGDLPYRVVGAQRKTVTNVAMDSSYPTGGEVVTWADLGLTRVDYAEASIFTAATTTVNSASAAYTPGDGTTTSLLQVFDETPGEVAGSADLAGLVVQVVAYGV